MVLEYTVFCEASLLRYGRVMQILLSKGEMAPDMLITSHVLCEPLWLSVTKGHLVSVRGPAQSCWKEEQGQYFSKTKSMMTFFTVALTFCLKPFVFDWGYR